MSLDLKRQLVAQLVESSRLLRNYIDNRAKSRGTTRAQWIVLFRLRQQEGLSQVDLAEVLELQPISLVRLLDRLVDAIASDVLRDIPREAIQTSLDTLVEVKERIKSRLGESPDHIAVK